MKRWRRWLKRLLWTTAAGALLLGGFVTWVLLTCFAEPPALSGRPAILDAELTTGLDGRRQLGRSWFLERPGHSLLYVEGDPFTLGYSNAALCAHLLAAQERELIETVRGFLPGTVSLYSAAILVLFHNRNLPDYVPAEYQQEIFGLSHRSGEDPYAGFGSRYHRILNYHAAHDISHWIWDAPALGCTAFAASGARTVGGRLLVGRNFDWESGDHFDVNKVIALYRPTNGHAFLSVSWPGMAGAVTGMNDARIFCSINGAHTEHMGLGVGRPVSLVVREVLQYSADLDDAIGRIRGAPVFVADSFLVADGKTGEAVVVEKTPATCAVRRMRAGLVLQANHFETEELGRDTGNLRYMRDGTSMPRRARLAELLGRHSGALDPRLTAEILRDHRGVGDVDRGLGDRATINPMIATHAVVADVTTGILWVSRGRHQLGAFDAYAVEGFGRPAASPIPADPALTDGTYARLTRCRTILARLQAALDAGQPLTDADRAELREAETLNPGAPDVLTLRADVLVADGDAAALAACRRALDAHPAFRPVRERLRATLDRLRATGTKRP